MGATAGCPLYDRLVPANASPSHTPQSSLVLPLFATPSQPAQDMENTVASAGS